MDFCRFLRSVKFVVRPLGRFLGRDVFLFLYTYIYLEVFLFFFNLI